MTIGAAAARVCAPPCSGQERGPAWRPERRPSRLVAVVLAAGGSSRLGYPKQLLRIAGATLIARTVLAARAAGVARVFVVTGAHAAPVSLAAVRAGARTVRNPRWREGMSGSIHRGVRAAAGAGAGAVLMLTCDQPSLGRRELAKLVAAWRARPQRPCAATYDGVPGVPAIIPRRLFSELRHLTGDRGARALLRRGGVTLLPMSAAALDVDRPGDLTARFSPPTALSPPHQRRRRGRVGRS